MWKYVHVRKATCLLLSKLIWWWLFLSFLPLDLFDHFLSCREKRETTFFSLCWSFDITGTKLLSSHKQERREREKGKKIAVSTKQNISPDNISWRLQQKWWLGDICRNTTKMSTTSCGRRRRKFRSLQGEIFDNRILVRSKQF